MTRAQNLDGFRDLVNAHERQVVEHVLGRDRGILLLIMLAAGFEASLGG